MKIKSLFFVLFCFYVVQSFAQYSLAFDKYHEDKKYDLNLSSFAAKNSNSITNQFTNYYLFDGFISQKVKERTVNRLNDFNHIGAEFNSSISFTQHDSLNGKAGWGWFTSVHNNEMLNTTFRDNLFILYFKGNKSLAGFPADVSGSSFQLLRYQQVKLGFTKKFILNEKKHLLGFAVAFNKGQENINISVPKGSIYTQELGEYIDLDFKVRADRTNANRNGYTNVNGVGAALDLFYVLETKNNNFLNLSLENVGFIQWNKDSQHLSKDTSIRFEGLQLNDIFSINKGFYNPVSTDSLVKEYSYGDKKESYRTYLPLLTSINYVYKINKKVEVLLGAKYMFFSNSDPLVFEKVRYHISKNFLLSYIMSYGGYGNGNFGLESVYSFAKGHVFVVGSNSLNGLILPKYSEAQVGYFTYRYFFN